MISYTEKYAVVTPESCLSGEYDHTGLFSDDSASFDYVANMLEGTEPSNLDTDNLWFTRYQGNEATFYYPKTTLDALEMLKAWNLTN